MRIATRLLDEGEAKAAFDRIVAAQGRHATPVLPGAHTEVVRATTAGRVAAIDGLRISGVARAAGAPRQAGAGVDLLCTVGAHVVRGQPLYRIHAESAVSLEAALAQTGTDGPCREAMRIDPD